ncbi:hypothetical protein J437_LFUL015813 [Ladona fulva]|uniref:Uncharacterized protein n=1 Tax=Ladona fulva TaxID=123851 RepID=A0A8K0KK27_LADFU|nr:hypothetical protein J437_LFUL015813 [Ladona fulva]
MIVNNGRLTDLTTIFRSGNVNLDYIDRELLLDANIGFKDLVFGYDFSAKFMGIGPKGYITGRADDINNAQRTSEWFGSFPGLAFGWPRKHRIAHLQGTHRRFN